MARHLYGLSPDRVSRATRGVEPCARRTSFDAAGAVFTVNVLKQGQLELARRFGTRSGRDLDKLAGLAWLPGRNGGPILEDALAYFDCELSSTMSTGDHELVVGRVIDGR